MTVGRYAWLSVFFATVAAPALGAEWAIREVATSEQIAPGGFGPDYLRLPFGGFEEVHPIISGQGDVAFTHGATPSVGGLPLRALGGVWSERGGVLKDEALSYYPAPGFPDGSRFGLFSFLRNRPVYLPDGDLVFHSYVGIPGVGNSGDEALWRYGPSGGELLFFEGEPAEALDDVLSLRDVRDYFVNPLGMVAVESDARRLSDNQSVRNVALLADGPGSVELVAYPGGPFELLPEDEFVAELLTTGLSDDGASLLQFYGSSTDPLLALKRPGEKASLVFRAGDAAPVLNGLFDAFYTSSIGPNGEIAFVGQTSDGATGLWRGTPEEGFELVVQTGDPAPGTTRGVFELLDLREEPQFNRRGDLLVPGGHGSADNGTSADAFWLDPADGPLRLVVAVGQPAPGAGAEVRFRRFDEVAFSDSGGVAFVGRLEGLGVDDSNDLGVWFEGPAGLVPVVREGDEINVDGALRTVRTVSFSGGAGGESGLNDAGQIAVALSFTDGLSGVYVLTPVPEPATAMLVALALVASPRRMK